MDKFSELKAAAMAATLGPWFRSSVQFNGITTEATFITQGNKPHLASTSEKRDAIFIVAANPAVVLELLAELEAKDKRILELDYLRLSACEVFKEIGNELGCKPDNESIMMAIDELKATQVTGPLALIIKRAEEMERILEGITPEMIAGGWTAKGISDYAKSLEAKLATPVRLPNKNDAEFWFDGVFQVAKFDRAVERAISAAGFKFGEGE